MALDAGHGPAVPAVRARYKERHWAYGRERLEQMHTEGPLEFRSTGMPVYKRYTGLKSLL